MLSNALVAGLTSDMIPRSVYASSFGPCTDLPLTQRLLKSDCYDGYDKWSMQATNITELDYGRDKNGRIRTLQDIWRMKNTDFAFEDLVKDNKNIS